MKLPGIFKKNGDTSNPIIDAIKEDNQKRIKQLTNRIQKEHNTSITSETITQLSLKRLLDCYTYSEIIHILHYYKQLPEGSE